MKQNSRQKQASSRETAALSVEHEMLSKQVAQMKEFLRVNEGQRVPDSPNMEESMTYASAQQALSNANSENNAAELRQLREENEELTE